MVRLTPLLGVSRVDVECLLPFLTERQPLQAPSHRRATAGYIYIDAIASANQLGIVEKDMTSACVASAKEREKVRRRDIFVLRKNDSVGNEDKSAGGLERTRPF